MRAAHLRLEGIRVVRGGRAILNVPELDVAPGEFLGVAGANGSGKTTLLHACAGLLRPTAGRVWLDGEDVAAASAWRRTVLRQRVGYVPQATAYNAHLPLTVAEVVAMGRVGRRGLLRWPGREDRAAVSAWMARLGLDPLALRTFHSLSGGEQQKVLLARAMVQEPALLLLDEPAANLDLDWKARLLALLEGLLRADAPTVVMVSHETGLLPEWSGRVALMRHGAIARIGTPADVITSSALAETYGCPVEVAVAQGRRHAVARYGGGP